MEESCANACPFKTNVSDKALTLWISCRRQPAHVPSTSATSCLTGFAPSGNQARVCNQTFLTIPTEVPRTRHSSALQTRREHAENVDDKDRSQPQHTATVHLQAISDEPYKACTVFLFCVCVFCLIATLDKSLSMLWFRAWTAAER